MTLVWITTFPSPLKWSTFKGYYRYSARALVTSSSSTDATPVDEESQKYVLDTHLGIQQVGGDLANYRELLTDFVQELPAKIQLMHDFCEARDTEKLSRAAHNLKGVAANLAARQLSNSCSQA